MAGTASAISVPWQETACDTIKNYILDKIHRKLYCPGQMIDSESDLARRLDVSRMAVRKALDVLTQKGIIFKEKGRGTFAAMQPRYAEFQYGAGFALEARKRGIVPSTRNASLKLCSADETSAQEMNLKTGDKVWLVTRVRCADGVPVAYVSEYYNYLHCEDLNEEIICTSIYEHLEKNGITFAFLDQKLETVACPCFKEADCRQNYLFLRKYFQYKAITAMPTAKVAPTAVPLLIV